ncbi:uncharacterized protein LOC142341748 [Convolutriloba macropyga]|uniref:uncharacterized protein LOC142341748 n=1 Tax=Convolutriloba macropyga TaxID=536237 RepID=UPI003F5285A4
MEKREVLKTWELSLYELQRRPQEAVTDETEIKINPRILHSELMCPICLDVMSNTMTTKECLHRFCSECIITALRNGNKECPTCRNKLVSKRSLRRDPNFDALISKICPSSNNEGENGTNGHNGSFMNSPVDSPLNNADDNDDHMDESGGQEQAGRRKRLSRSATATADTSEVINDATAPAGRKVLKRESSESAAKTNKSSTATTASNSSSPAKTSIDIILRLKPQNLSTDGPDEKNEDSKDELQQSNEQSNGAADSTNNDQMPICKFLKTTRDASIEHLAVYIKLRKDEIKDMLPQSLISDLDRSLVELFVKKRQTTPPEFIQIEKDFTLSHVMSEYNMPRNRPLELYFSVIDSN